jgi:hypothetical protein
MLQAAGRVALHSSSRSQGHANAQVGGRARVRRTSAGAEVQRLLAAGRRQRAALRRRRRVASAAEQRHVGRARRAAQCARALDLHPVCQALHRRRRAQDRLRRRAPEYSTYAA